MSAPTVASSAPDGAPDRDSPAAAERHLLASFVLGADEPALDLQAAIVIDADEDARAGDLGPVID